MAPMEETIASTPNNITMPTTTNRTSRTLPTATLSTKAMATITTIAGRC